MFCPNCNIVLRGAVETCPSCGHNISEAVLKEIQNEQEELKKYEGLGGWLYAVFAVLAVMVVKVFSGSLETVKQISDSANTTSIEVYIPGYLSMLKIDLVCQISLGLLGIYLIVLFFRKSRKFPKIYIAMYVIAFLYAASYYIYINSFQVMTSELGELFDEIKGVYRTDMIRVGFTAIVWAIYMNISKRVKSTFVQ